MGLDVTFTKGKLVNKSQVIDALAARFQGNRKQAAHALESVLDTITREVAKGEKVAITGFGSFERRIREARMVRNPRTGERIRAKKTAVPKFSAGADLKAVVSGAKKLPKVTLDTAGQAAPAAKRTAAAAKKTATKAAATARKSAAKKSTAKKSAAKKSTARKAPAKKTTAKKSTAKKTTAKKAPAKKTATRKTAAKKSTAKKTTARKAPARKAAAKKTAAKKSPAKKTAKRAAKKA
jgi:DNA-binding protein HU-beta